MPNPTLAAKDPQRLLQRIKTEFPQLTWSSYEYLDHGWDHEVLLLDGNLVFRFPNSPEYLQIFKDEAGLLDFLAPKIPLKIPRYKYVARNYSFGGYQLIHGAELEEAVFHRLDAGNQQRIAQQIAQFLSALHIIDPRELAPFHVRNEKPFDDYNELAQAAKQHLQPVLSQQEYEVVQKVAASIADIHHSNLPSAFTHGDISPKHLIWDAHNGEVGFIDFSDRSFADPAADFAELYAYGQDFVEQVYKDYQGPKDPAFLDRAKTYQKQIGVFLMVDAFRNQKVSFTKAKHVFDQAIKL